MTDTEYRAEQIAAVAREIARLDLVKVVRCRDCEFYKPEQPTERSGIFDVEHPSWCDRHIVKTKPDGYCAWAVKRKECGDD